MSKIAYNITRSGLVLVINNKTYCIPMSSPQAPQVVTAVERNASCEEILGLISLATAIGVYSGKDVEMRDGKIYRNGECLPESLGRKILACMQQGMPYSYLTKFFEKLRKNPSQRSLEFLYNFLEYEGLPITAEGNFLGYKAIRNDWTDKHSGVYSNTVGSVLTMERNKVCDDANIGCSTGFHVGSLEYVLGFANTHQRDRIVIVEVDPADVVSVPHDCAFQKVRTCRYKVVGEYAGRMADGVVEDVDEIYPDLDQDPDTKVEIYVSYEDVELSEATQALLNKLKKAD